MPNDTEREGEEQTRTHLPKLPIRQQESEPAMDDPVLLGRLRRLLEAYSDQVNASDLSVGSKAIYVQNAECFVRWVHGSFTPGINGPCFSDRLKTSNTEKPSKRPR
jgi:hypothetical protein